MIQIPGAAANEGSGPRSGSPPPGQGVEAPVLLEPVIVTAPRIPSRRDEVPSAVRVVEEEAIRLGQPTVSLQESLVRVPGVLVRNQFNFAQGLRVSIRGFGGRSAFGVRGIQVYADGIPLTLPDGQTQMDLIDPAAIERIEVIRGPMSALYGNAAGGVIQIITRQGTEEPFAGIRQTVGEYGLSKTTLQTGGRTDFSDYFLNVSHLDYEGFREHGKARGWNLNGKARWQATAASDVTLLVNAVRLPTAQDPGGLTREQARSDPSQASPLALRFDTREEIAAEQLGLVYRIALTPRQNIEAAGYYSRRDLDNAIPFRVIDLQRQVYGARLQYDVRSELLGFDQITFAGVELQRQMDDRLNYSNEAGAAGNEVLLDQEEKVSDIGVYLQEEIRPATRWSVVAGGRYDRVQFEVDDRLAADGDDSGDRTFDQITGRAGLNYFPTPGLQWYASIAQSFEAPTTTELVNRPAGGGGINPDIEPQRATSYEVGVKGVYGRRLSYEMAFFLVRLEDELIPFRDPTDRVFYRNAGESQRIGVEWGASAEIFEGLRLNAAYTYLDARFETYIKNGEDLKDNEVPGLPQQQLFGEVLYRHASGGYAGLGVLHMGELFLNDENTEEDPAHTVVDLRAGYLWEVRHWELEPFVGVKNLLDETYNGNVRINANGGRYFEPAPERIFYGGVNLVYRW